jgi:hypothetical protein
MCSTWLSIACVSCLPCIRCTGVVFDAHAFVLAVIARQLLAYVRRTGTDARCTASHAKRMAHPHMKNQTLCISLAVLASLRLFACASSEDSLDAQLVNAATAVASADTFTLSTGELTVPAGKERFLCYAKTLEQALVVDSYRSDALPYVHHLVLARALAPEPEGFAECDTLFRMTWDPLYIAGSGESKLEFPNGAGHALAAGTQLVVQMHLLNASDADVQGSVEIAMHRARVATPRPVNTYIFGTTDLRLPPKQPSVIQSLCELGETVQLIAGFPHMHEFGRKLRFESGPNEAELHTVLTRDPYEFADQHIEALSLTLNPGDLTRVTCQYDNTSSRTVGFGESTQDEMCFFIGFALDQTSIKSCATRTDL